MLFSHDHFNALLGIMTIKHITLFLLKFYDMKLI